MRALPLCLTVLTLAAPTLNNAQVRESWVLEAGVTSIPPVPATVAALALSMRSRAIQDSRCYLMSGGAVESFFISEDTPVGSVIGTLSVNGDPDEEVGDIILHVQEKGAAVGIAAGSKNLTLLRALDREERLGPSNVYVNVRCDRKRTTDPSFVIPVSVRVWDVNDNAPWWVGAPYHARVPEHAAVGTRVAAARATDADQPGPAATVRYTVLASPYSEYIGFANELEGTLVVLKQLDYESLPARFSLPLRAQDQGSPPLHNDTTLTIDLLDSDDQNPKFTHEHYTALLPENATTGSVLSVSPGPILAADQDAGIMAPLEYAATGEHAALVGVQRDSGRLTAAAGLLRITHPVTIVIKATQVDNPDRYALSTLTVSPRSTRGIRFTRDEYFARVAEDAPPGTVVITLTTDPPAHSPLQFFVSERSFLEKFGINGGGEVVLRRPLDFETKDQYHYQVMLTDGLANDTASLNITVVNVNEWEPRFRYPQYEFFVEVAPTPAPTPATDGLLPVGKLDVFDGDKADNVTLTLRGPDASALFVSGGGEMFLRQEAVPHLNTSVLDVLATARDSGHPPRQSSVPVRVHVRGLRAAEQDGSTLTVVGAAGGAAAVILLLLATALLYGRTRRRAKSSPAPVSKPYLAHPPTSPASRASPARSPPAPTGSLQSVSAGASTILANSTSSLDLRDNNGNAHGSGGGAGRGARVSPLGAGGPGGAGGAGAGAGAGPHVAQMSDHLARGAGGGRSGVAWPAATIPARVKKLSWDTAAQQQDSAEASPLEATNTAAHDHMNLTVYF